MKYAVNLEPNKLNCFPETHWSEHNNFEVLSQEPYNNVLFEHEFEDLTTDDLVCVNGAIQVDLEKYHASRLSVEIEQLRATRNALLKAFDVYKSNVNYGVEIETQEQHEEMRVWYLAILELDTYAIENPPFKISYYLGV